jgi:hypothetical protein
VAIAVLVLLQIPPAAVSLRLMVVPAHTVDGPLMVPACGSGLTVMDCIAVAVPQLLVTV